MKLCVGAVSRRVVEEAAKLGVHQIIASRGQADIGGGYTGMDQEELVHIVRTINATHKTYKTDVIRDHGGPLQGKTPDDGIDSFDADVSAGFDGLHIDVCKLEKHDQVKILPELIKRYCSDIDIQIGGEHDDQEWTERLLAITLSYVIPSYAVINLGGYVNNDRQFGRSFMSYARALDITDAYNQLGTKSVAHNMDFVGNRVNAYVGALDAYNIAPEFGMVEVDAILTVMPAEDAHLALEHAYTTRTWLRWFAPTEGTWFERAKCAMRYTMHTDPFMLDIIQLDASQDNFVRTMISEAIRNG